MDIYHEMDTFYTITVYNLAQGGVLGPTTIDTADLPISTPSQPTTGHKAWAYNYRYS